MEQRNILLIGKTGDGKSSAGNTILRKKVFTPKASASSATDEPVKGHELINEKDITVFNTPGFFNTDQDDECTKSEIIEAMMDTPEIHAIVFVLKVGRYTKHENQVVEEYLNLVKYEHVQRHTVILFTFGDQLEDQNLNEFIKSNSKLQEFVNKCEGRCHVIDNKYWNDPQSGEKSNTVQVNNLLDTIDKMVQKNGCFTSEPLQDLKEVMKEINNLPPEDQQKAKKMVQNTILKQVVGGTTGALIGAFLGVTVFGVILFKIPLKELLKYIRLVKGAERVKPRAGAEAAGAAAVAGVVAGTGNSAVIIGAGALVGGVAGGITGWKAAEDAESVYDAMKKAAESNFENGKAVVEKVKELKSLLGNN